jgi:hypothetical protein
VLLVVQFSWASLTIFAKLALGSLSFTTSDGFILLLLIEPLLIAGQAT